MKVLWPVAVGLVLVGVEFRLDAPDVLADPVGWLLIALGAWLLTARGPALLALVAAPLSASTVWLDHREVLVDAATDRSVTSCGAGAFCYEQLRYDDLGDLRAMALLGSVLAGGAAVVWLLRILRTEVGDPDRQRGLRRQLALIEVTVAGVWVLPVASLTTRALLSVDDYDPVWNGNLELLVVARVAVVLWAAAVLVLFADRYPRPTRRPPPGG